MWNKLLKPIILALIAILLLVFALLPRKCHAEEPYICITRSVSPFSINQGGKWSGLSIELLDRILKNNGLSCQYTEFDTTASLIEQVKTKRADIAIGTISVTSDREKVVDFSQPYFTTSIGVMVNKHLSTWDTMFWFGEKILIAVLILVVSFYLMGFVICWADRRVGMLNHHEGAWWAIVTFVTVGYGDFVPKTPRGKFFASVWMISSLFALSSYTAWVSSSLTVSQIKEHPTTISDLQNTKVVTVAGTTSETYLTKNGIKPQIVDSVSSAHLLFLQGKVDAIVYDKTILDYMIHGTEGYITWKLPNSEEHYAIVTNNKVLNEVINITLLEELTSDTWKETKAKYLGL